MRNSGVGIRFWGIMEKSSFLESAKLDVSTFSMVCGKNASLRSIFFRESRLRRHIVGRVNADCASVISRRKNRTHGYVYRHVENRRTVKKMRIIRGWRLSMLSERSIYARQARSLRHTMERMRISGYVHAKKLIFPEFPISKRKAQLTHFPKASSSQK